MSVQSEKIEYQIVHAIAGRIRLKIPRLKRDPDYGERLQRLVKSLKPVTEVRLNSASASAIVHYNPRNIESKIMQRALAVCVWQADSNGAISIEYPLKLLTGTTEPQNSIIEAISPVTKQTEDNFSLETSQEHLSDNEQLPINVDLEQKVFEVGIPASYILEPLNAELEKFAAENEKNTESQLIKIDLEAFLRNGGFLIDGKANGWFREIFFINPFTGKKHYTPWISITAVGTAELEATVVDETINVNLTKLNVSGESGKWYKELVKYAFEYLFKTKLTAKINETLSKIDGAKIQQLFFDLKGDEKLRERSHELGLTSEKVDELLELVEVNARVSSDRVWLMVHL